MTGPPERDPPRSLRRLVAALRAGDGVAALGPACHREVPGVDGVVLTVSAPHAGRIILSDSGPRGDQLEDLHAILGEGPCIDTAAAAAPVAVVDLDNTRAYARWPRFAAEAVASGIRAVFAFPVLVDAQPIGVLSLYRATAGPLSAADQERVSHYTQAAATLLTEAHGHAAGPAGTPLPSQAAKVQQAVGVVMEYADVDATTALHRLRAYAHHSQRPMPDVVADVRAGRLPFDPTTPT